MKKLRMTALLMALAFTLGACKGGEQEVQEETESIFGKNHIFREEELEFGSETGNVSQFELVGDTIYAETLLRSSAEDEAGEASGEEAEAEAEESEAAEELEEQVPEQRYSRLIGAYNAKGEKLDEVKIELPMNAGPGTMTVDEQGNIFSTYTSYGEGEGGSEGHRVYLQGHSSAGEELFTLWLNENQGEDEYYYVNCIYCTADGKLLVETGNAVEVYDKEGNQVNRIEKGGSEMESRLHRIRDNQFVLFGMSEDKSFYQSIDLEAGKKGEEVDLPFIYYAYTILDGKYYDLYLSNEKGIFGYNLGDAEPTPIVDFLGSDFSSNGINQLGFIDEESFIALYYNDEGMAISRFIKVPEEEVVEKTELTLGCYYLDSEIKSQVVKFNKKSNTYRINIVDYSEYNTEEDYTIGQNRLNSDIASGNVPDIVLLHSGMPIESYMSKGVFADYYKLMEEDADFNREEYLPNLFKAYETEGKLYQMVPFFYIRTFVGKTADVGEDFSWTMDEALALQAKKPEGTALFPDAIQTDFLFQCLAINSQEYINWETGECFFDTDKFIQMMEYAKTLPKEYKVVDFENEEAYMEMEMQYREGRSLLAPFVLSTFRDYGNWKYATFGEDITMVGFPTETGIGSTFVARFNLAISEQSKNKQAAWDFVKSLLEEEYQNEQIYYFPARITSLEKLEKEAWENPYYLDENGNKVEYEQKYYVGNMEIPGKPLTKEETGTIMEFIKSIERTDRYNEEIFNIVSEETAAFFEGQKSAKETVDIIQSRARIYVNENR